MLLGSAFSETLPAIILLVVFTVAGGVIIFVARKKLTSNEMETSTFSLSQLRKLLANGSITQEEYDKAHESIVCMYKAERPISRKK